MLAIEYFHAIRAYLVARNSPYRAIVAFSGEHEYGGAQVSEKHTNFLINTGDATAADLEALGEEVRKRVQEKSGVTLEWEIKRVGVA